MVRERRKEPALSRFLNHVRFRKDDCWEWTAARNRGYPYFGLRNKMVRAHRWLWQICNYPLPKNLTLDHLCRRRWCVNPSHLEAVSLRENQSQANEHQRIIVAINAKQNLLISGAARGMPVGMDMDKPEFEERTINVLIRVTPEMHAELSKLADKMGKGWGVATVMRQIVQNALDEGINVKGGRRKTTRTAANGSA